MVRIQFSRQTVKGLQTRLCQAYQQGHVSRVRRISVLLEMGVHGTPVAVVSERWGISPACIYEWLKAFMLDGLVSVMYRPRRGGRVAKLTSTQKKQLCQLIDAGPEAAGFETACWNSILIQTVIQREFGVAYNRYYVCELLRNLGFSFQKARFVSDHLDEARRQAWLTEEWPKILKQAKRRRAWILFGDEVSFPQWGSLSRTWARQGQQPTVKTTGKRKGYKVFGFIEYFTGRFFHQAIEGRFTSESYQTFLLQVLAQTNDPLFIIQDGARYHTSKAMQQFWAEHGERITVYQLPSYSPDYNPIEYLWRKIKKSKTHNRYFAQFGELIATVDQALAYFAQHAQLVLNLFGLYGEETGLAQAAMVA
jgi:transposase